MRIECVFKDSHLGYGCYVEYFEIPLDERLDFFGVHRDGRTIYDVKFIQFSNCNLFKVPQRLTETFPNLEGMRIFKSGLKEVSRDDLTEYKNFTSLIFNENQISYLPSDLFADCKNLETISFRGELLTVIEPNILDGLEHLKFVDLNGKGMNYGRIDSHATFLINDPRLVAMKNKINDRFMKVSYSGLRTECQRLKEELTKFKSFIQSDHVFRDFYIKINDQQFHVHKILLAARSPTLAEMLRNNPDAENLNLVDISVETFEDILKFIYTDELPRNTNFIKLFSAAGLLKINELMDYAAEMVKFDDKNVLEVLNLGNKFEHDAMRQRAFEKIKQKYPKIEFKDEWSRDGEKIKKMIEIMKKQEEILRMQEETMKKLEEEMKELMD